MQITKTFRRAVATVILTAGLAYPACAAVCPKGIGGCPSPGRCFLFVDADGNTLCDYTARTGSQVQSAPVSIPTGRIPGSCHRFIRHRHLTSHRPRSQPHRHLDHRWLR